MDIPRVPTLVSVQTLGQQDQMRQLGAEHVVALSLEGTLRFSRLVLTSLGVEERTTECIVTAMEADDYAAMRTRKSSTSGPPPEAIRELNRHVPGNRPSRGRGALARWPPDRSPTRRLPRTRRSARAHGHAQPAPPARRGTYLELIATDPRATSPVRPRWFELDDPAMQARLAVGPRLVHWVARVETTEIPPLPFDVGPWERFERGDLCWQLTVRPDGTLPAGGVVPSLICWEGPAHPAARLPDSGVSLEALELEHPRAAEVQQQLDLLGLPLRCAPSSLPRIVARLRTPAGATTLDSAEPLR